MRLCRIAGTLVSIHFTTFLLLAYIGWEGWQDGGRWTGALWSMLFAVFVFTCILLHEFGHITAARVFGISSPRVVLMPIGGMAEFTEIPRIPRQEFLIAIAGPAVNGALILLLWCFAPFPRVAWSPYPHFPDLGFLELSFSGVCEQMIMVNAFMGLFNLIPCFPMDGGRVLRAALSTRFPYLKATFLAATVAKVVGLTLLVSCLFFKMPPLLPVLLIFILWAGESEYRTVRRRELWLRDYLHAQRMQAEATETENLPPSDDSTKGEEKP